MQARRLLPPLYLLIGTFILGTLGYYALGYIGAGTGEIAKPWTLINCAFMTAITLTTVGYGDWLGVAQYETAMLYTVVLLFVGMGVVLYGVSELTSFFVEGHLRNILERRKYMRKIETMNDHIILAGVGEVGINVLEELLAMDVPFIAIEHQHDRAVKLRERYPEAIIVHGDAIDEDVLAKASLAKARGLIACLPSDRDNLFLTVTARSLNAQIRIIARAESRRVESKLKAAGADRIVTPSVTGGLRLASEMIRPQVTTFLDRMIRENGQFRFSEVMIHPGAELDGQPLVGAKIRQRTGLNIVAVRDGEGNCHYNLDVERVLHAGDTLFAIGTPDMITALGKMAEKQ